MPHETNSLLDWSTSPFGRDFINGIIPWVDSHYHTCNQRTCRAIGGISRGAIWSVELGLSHWQLFGSIGGHSLPGAPFSESMTLDYLKAMHTQGYSRFYLDVGDRDDYLDGAETFMHYLDKYGVPFEWHLNPGAHIESYWTAHIAEYLSWYADGFSH
jgi:enterochelin esterase-like enzyme